jgi:hypothetical protein
LTTVYILGAGASAGYDRSAAGLQCPSAKNFFKVAESIMGPGTVSREKYGHMLRFLEKYYNLSYSEIGASGMDMQDVLTFLDLEIDYSDSAQELALLGRARNEFMDLLTTTFNSVLKGPPCPYHAALAQGLCRGDAVISFNYDLLMDTALFHSCPLWSPSSGYGFQAAPADDSLKHRSEVHLLKPHGSFNWLACRTCGNVYILPPTGPVVPVSHRSYRPLPGEPAGHRLERLIVPPSLKKDVHGSIMQQVWQKAGQALMEAHRIVIIGYSLPAADFLVKRLLYRSLSHNGHLRELELVDRNNGRSARALVKKYEQLLYNSPGSVRLLHNKRNIREYVACRPQHQKNCDLPADK